MTTGTIVQLTSTRRVPPVRHAYGHGRCLRCLVLSSAIRTALTRLQTFTTQGELDDIIEDMETALRPV